MTCALTQTVRRTVIGRTMTTDLDIQLLLAKAERSLAGAASEHINERYDNTANRCYYACFQAAIAALMRAGIRPSDPGSGWGHGYVQAQFAEQLIRRRKEYSADLGDVLVRLLALRRTADYRAEPVSEPQATRALRRARQFIATIQTRGGEPR